MTDADADARLAAYRAEAARYTVERRADWLGPMWWVICDGDPIVAFDTLARAEEEAARLVAERAG